MVLGQLDSAVRQIRGIRHAHWSRRLVGTAVSGGSRALYFQPVGSFNVGFADRDVELAEPPPHPLTIADENEHNSRIPPARSFQVFRITKFLQSLDKGKCIWGSRGELRHLDTNQ